MDALLKSLEQFKEMQLVRFFAQFFNEDRLSSFLQGYKQRVEADAGGLAGELFLWAVLLALLVFAVDQLFYWTAPGRMEQARESWQAFVDSAWRAWDGVKGFAARVASGPRNGEGPRGRR